jgi:hypothetical protein
MALYSCYSSLARQDLVLNEKGLKRLYTRKSSSRNYCKTLSAIQWSDQKLWPFSAVIAVRRDKTSSSTSRDSICNTRKTAFRNYCKTLSAIQRSDQKLWPFSAVIPVRRDKTCSSTSRDSIGNTRKTTSHKLL